MAEGIRRELVYFWYYFSVQFNQIAFYWILGMGIGFILSVTDRFCSTYHFQFRLRGNGRAFGALVLSWDSLFYIPWFWNAGEPGYGSESVYSNFEEFREKHKSYCRIFYSWRGIVGTISAVCAIGNDRGTVWKRKRNGSADRCNYRGSPLCLRPRNDSVIDGLTAE